MPSQFVSSKVRIRLLPGAPQGTPPGRAAGRSADGGEAVVVPILTNCAFPSAPADGNDHRAGCDDGDREDEASSARHVRHR